MLQKIHIILYYFGYWQGKQANKKTRWSCSWIYWFFGLLLSKTTSHFPGGTSGKEPTCQCEGHRRCDSIPGLGRSPRVGHGNPLQYSSLENPMDKGAWQATVPRVSKSQTWLKQLSTQYIHAITFSRLKSILLYEQITLVINSLLAKNEIIRKGEGKERWLWAFSFIFSLSRLLLRAPDTLLEHCFLLSSHCLTSPIPASLSTLHLRICESLRGWRPRSGDVFLLSHPIPAQVKDSPGTCKIGRSVELYDEIGTVRGASLFL